MAGPAIEVVGEVMPIAGWMEANRALVTDRWFRLDACGAEGFLVRIRLTARAAPRRATWSPPNAQGARPPVPVAGGHGQSRFARLTAGRRWPPLRGRWTALVDAASVLPG